MSFPCRSVTMRGRAVPTTVWSSAARKRPSMTAATICARTRGSSAALGALCTSTRGVEAMNGSPSRVWRLNTGKGRAIRDVGRTQRRSLDVLRLPLGFGANTASPRSERRLDLIEVLGPVLSPRGIEQALLIHGPHPRRLQLRDVLVRVLRDP